MIKDDLDKFKDEINIKLLDLEMKYLNSTEFIMNKLTFLTQNDDNPKENLFAKLHEIESLMNKEKVQIDHIHGLMTFKETAFDDIKHHENKLEQIQNEIKRAFSKYDKIFLDNLNLPGVIGDNCKFKSMKEFVEFTLSNIGNLQPAKDSTLYEIKLIKDRIDQIVKNINSQIEASERGIKQYIKSSMETIEFNLKQDISSISNRFGEIKIENHKSVIEIKSHSAELRTELNKINSDLDNRFSLTNEELKKSHNLFDKSKEEFDEFKRKLNEKIDSIVKYNKDQEIKKTNNNNSNSTTMFEKKGDQKSNFSNPKIIFKQQHLYDSTNNNALEKLKDEIDNSSKHIFKEGSNLENKLIRESVAKEKSSPSEIQNNNITKNLEGEHKSEMNLPKFEKIPSKFKIVESTQKNDKEKENLCKMIKQEENEPTINTILNDKLSNLSVIESAMPVMGPRNKSIDNRSLLYSNTHFFENNLNNKFTKNLDVINEEIQTKKVNSKLSSKSLLKYNEQTKDFKKEEEEFHIENVNNKIDKKREMEKENKVKLKPRFQIRMDVLDTSKDSVSKLISEKYKFVEAVSSSNDTLNTVNFTQLFVEKINEIKKENEIKFQLSEKRLSELEQFYKDLIQALSKDFNNQSPFLPDLHMRKIDNQNIHSFKYEHKHEFTPNKLRSNCSLNLVETIKSGRNEETEKCDKINFMHKTCQKPYSNSEHFKKIYKKREHTSTPQRSNEEGLFKINYIVIDKIVNKK